MLKLDPKVLQPYLDYLKMPVSCFCPHWHGRDFEHWNKDTLEHALLLAEAAGLAGLAAMPNPEPPLTTLELCRAYMSLADRVIKKYKLSLKFYVHIGLTPNTEQVKRAIEATRLEKRIISMKAYWGRSTGSLSIIHEDQQLKVWETLAKEGYEKVVIGHHEDESLMNDKLFKRDNPITWSLLCRPEIAEISSYKKHIAMAESVKFPGRIHVAHVSTCEVVDLINAYNGPLLRPSCGVTPHHWIFDNTLLNAPYGCEVKCNPALRDETTRAGIQRLFFDGKIDLQESDHAPHSEEDKKAETPASGLACGSAWPYTVAIMRALSMNETQVKNVTFGAAVSLFGLTDKVEYKPRVPDFKKLAELQKGYHFDPFYMFKA